MMGSNLRAGHVGSKGFGLIDRTWRCVGWDAIERGEMNKAGKLSRLALAAILSIGLVPSPAFASEGEEAFVLDSPAQESRSAVEPFGSLDRSQEAALSYDFDQASHSSARSSESAASALSSGEVRSGDWGYYEIDGAAMVSGYYGNAVDVELPSSLDGLTVDSVRFDRPSTLKIRSIVVPSTVKTIGGFAFEGMETLESVTFSADSRLEVIGDEAFAYTGITSFAMPASLRTLGQIAFLGCHDLRTVEFNDVLDPISRQENIMSGSENYRYVSYSAIAPYCDDVEFVVPSTSVNFKTVDGALLSKDGSIFYERPYSDQASTFTVPSGVITLARYAFCGQTGLSSVVLPDGLKDVHDYAFSRSGLRSLAIPDSVTNVYGSICYECPGLREVVIGDGVTELGTCAGWNDFYGCSNLEKVTLGESVEVIGNACFAETALSSVDIPASVRQINYGAFGDTPSLVEVTGAEGLETIYRLAFRGANLSHFPFGDNLTFVSGDAFYRCSSFDGAYPSYLSQDSAGDWTRNGATADGDGTLLIEGTEGYSLAYQVLDAVNAERAAVGLGPLSMDEDLMEAAMQRAAETVVHFSHTRPDGRTCFTVSSKANGENIASGSSTAAGVMDQWMNSEGHRANILDGSWNSIGIGCYRANNGVTYWVQLFGSGFAQAASRPADRAASRYVSVSTSEVDPSLRMSLSSSEGGSTMTVGSVADATVMGTGSEPWPVSYEVANEGFKWSSSDPSVLSVDSFGHVSAVSSGRAILTASSGKLAASLTVTVSSAEPSVVFSDVEPGSWYEDAVVFASQAGLIKGYSGTTLFGVGDAMTRAQFVTILWRYAEPEEAAVYDGKAPNETGLHDVEADQFWTAAANWAVANDVIDGVEREDGSREFDPEGAVTREQMALILANFNGIDADTYPTNSLATFPDVVDVDGWAAGGMAWAVDNGVLSGVDEEGVRYLRPTKQATREQAALVFMNAIESGVM